MHKTKNLHEKIVIFSLKKRLLFFSIRSGQLSYFDTHFCGAESNNDFKTIFVFSFIIKTKKFTPKLHISHLINGWHHPGADLRLGELGHHQHNCHLPDQVTVNSIQYKPKFNRTLRIILPLFSILAQF